MVNTKIRLIIFFAVKDGEALYSQQKQVGLKFNIQKTKIMAPSPIISWHKWETVETVADYFFGLQKSLKMVTAAMKLKDAWSLEEKL